ncbi:MAG: LURP-one-related family protein [Anaerolineales bacterium]
MHYQLHQKLASFGGGSIIQDEHGNVLYTVSSKIGLGKRLEFKDMQDNILVSIQQKAFSGSPTYEVKLSNGLSATMSRKGLFGPDKLKIVVAGQGEMEGKGSFAKHELAILHEGRPVAKFSRTLVVGGNTQGDPYGIEIEDGQDQVLLLCCAVVMDEIHELQTD